MKRELNYRHQIVVYMPLVLLSLLIKKKLLKDYLDDCVKINNQEIFLYMKEHHTYYNKLSISSWLRKLLGIDITYSKKYFNTYKYVERCLDKQHL